MIYNMNSAVGSMVKKVFCGLFLLLLLGGLWAATPATFAAEDAWDLEPIVVTQNDSGGQIPTQAPGSLGSAADVDEQGGFVTCARGGDCDFCDVASTFARIINWLVLVLSLIAVLMFVYAGYRLTASRGNPQELGKAKDILINVCIGFVLIMSAWMIIGIILKAFIGGNLSVWEPISSQCGGQNESGEATNEIQGTDENPVTELPFGDNENIQEDEIVETNPTSAAVHTGSFVPVTSGPTGFDSNGFISVGGVYGPSGANISVTVNEAMNPIFDPQQGGSSMVRPGAAARMQETLAGPFAQLQQSFGEPLIINDAIAKAGTSRETKTTGSRHFFGDALDISIAGMSDVDKLRLYSEAKRAGFTGFGFGRNILHIDRGAPRGWHYGNSTFGGRSVDSLINSQY